MRSHPDLLWMSVLKPSKPSDVARLDVRTTEMIGKKFNKKQDR
jgi:hypothetical protein